MPVNNNDLKILAIREWKKINAAQLPDDIMFDDVDIIDLDGLDFHASDGWCTSFKKKHRISSVTSRKKE